MIVFDIEASGLHQESYPIQIAWVDTETSENDSFYITPHEDWTFWSENAEAIHNIPQKLLRDVGISTQEAIDRLIERLGTDVELYCDAPDFDGFWLTRLLQVVEHPNLNWTVSHVVDVLDNLDEMRFLQHCLMSQNRPHDALDDAKMIADAVRMARDKQ